MSDDLVSIQRSIAQHRQIEQIQQGMNSVWTRFPRDFELIAKFLQGEEHLRFRVLRALSRHFSRWEIFMLSHLSSPTSHQDWRLVIRPRRPRERPDGGQKLRRRFREDRADQLGMRVYALMKAGETKRQAIEAARQELGISLSDQAVEKDLGAFRARVMERGFVDPYAAISAAVFGYPPVEPDLKVADVMKKGRPKKR
jgi:hypothetical protein